MHALENRLMATRIQVLPSEMGRSLMKSTPMWEQGLCGTGSATSCST